MPSRSRDIEASRIAPPTLEVRASHSHHGRVSDSGEVSASARELKSMPLAEGPPATPHPIHEHPIALKHAVASAIRARASQLASIVGKIEDGPRDPRVEHIHKLRVASRRLSAAIKVLGSVMGGAAESVKRLGRISKQLRSGAGALRDADVHLELVRRALEEPQDRPFGAVNEAVALITEDRRQAAALLRHVVRECGSEKLCRRGKAAAAELRDAEDAHQHEDVIEPTRRRASAIFEQVAVASAGNLANTDELHRLRLSIKSLRYAREALAMVHPGPPLDTKGLAEIQARLGDLNDVSTLADRLARYIAMIDSQHQTEMLPPTARLREGLHSLMLGYRVNLVKRAAAFDQWWRAERTIHPIGRLAPELPPPRPSLLHASSSAPGIFAQTENALTMNASPTPSISTPPSSSSTPAGYYALHRPVESAHAAHANGPHAVATLSRSAASAPAHGNGHAAARITALPSDIPLGKAGLWLAGLVLGVIDVGSNSIRLLVVELTDERTWRSLAEDRAMTRLAHGIAEDGRLCAEAMARSVETIARFKEMAAAHGVKDLRAYATAAVRDAANGADFMALVHERTGLKVEVVSCEEEGRLTHASVARVADLSQGVAAVADMGGGSLEVVFSNRGVITSNLSMPLGAVRITEQFGGPDVAFGPRFDSMRRFIARTLRQSVPRPEKPPQVLIGCGGTFTTIATLIAAGRGMVLDRKSPLLATFAPVPRDEIKSLIKHLCSLTIEQRLRVPGLPADRADIVIAGLVAIERTMKRLGCEELRVHSGGIREGLILKLAAEHLAAKQQAIPLTGPQVVSAARALAARCGYELPHSEHVARLSVTLYDQLLERKDLVRHLGEEPLERAILEAGAVLHDIGVMIGYPGHQRHSAAIIRQNGLESVPARLVEIIALIARYHRKSGPSTRHRAFTALPAGDQELVTRLVGILRVADGLDRSHAQQVASMSVHPGKGVLRVEIGGEGDLTADHDAAMDKADVLERYMEMAVDVVVGSGVE